jgi:hypothetical protein
MFSTHIPSSDTIHVGVKVEGAVFISTFDSFRWFIVSFFTPLFVECGGSPPGEPVRLERSLGFLLPGESVEFPSLFASYGTLWQSVLPPHTRNISRQLSSAHF